MTVTVAEFWRLALESGLIEPDQRQQLSDEFAQITLTVAPLG